MRTDFGVQRTKDKFWYVRLSPNHRVLHYGDCDENSSPALDELTNKLAVVDISGLLTGKVFHPTPYIPIKKSENTR